MKTYPKTIAIFTIVLAVTIMAFSNSKLLEPIERQGVAVVQLFTSQGCSSCPRADELLSRIKSDNSLENVYVLSYHVDYWDRLGWKDPFSNKKNTELQYKYGSQLPSGNVYTPQAVVNGKIEFVGSDKIKMYAALKNEIANNPENEVVLSKPDLREKEVRVHYVVKGDVDDKHIVVNLIIDKRSTEIGRGENGGKNLENVNIVVQDFALPLMKTEGIVVVNIPEIVKASDKLSVVGFVQKSDLSITGAASIKVN